jgi:hypothetical protein
MQLPNLIYMPQLKWKAGEVRALASTPSKLAERMVPLFKIVPGGGFDPIEKRNLSTVENIKLFGRRITQAWGRRLAFVDAELIDGERHSNGLQTHPLTELLERARLEGANVAPVVSVGASVSYAQAVRTFCVSHPGSPLCLRVRLQDLEEIASLDELGGILEAFGSTPARTILLIDGGPIHVTEPAAFTHLLAGHVGRLAPAGAWLRVFWSSTTFPDKPKLKAGETGRFTRSDWILYQAILASREEFATLPLYSDYALEYPGQYEPLKVAPTAHFRYSTERDYLIFKGHTTRKPHGYQAIFAVARSLLSSDDFQGAAFSAGDAYISALAIPGARSGNASIWRWASTDHHFRMIHSSLGKHFGLPEVTSETAGNAEQLLLV